MDRRSFGQVGPPDVYDFPERISSAQARAVAVSGDFVPGIVAHPLFSTNVACSHELARFKAISCAADSLSLRKLARQIGAKAATSEPRWR
jgi:hypothetical protein